VATLLSVNLTLVLRLAGIDALAADIRERVARRLAGVST
jgi:hypothetical protein